MTRRTHKSKRKPRMDHLKIPLEDRLKWTGPKREKVLLKQTCCGEPLVELRLNGERESVYCQGRCFMPKYGPGAYYNSSAYGEY